MRRATTKGFAKTSTLLRERIRKAGESRGFAVSRVLTHWAEIVGADMAAICKPVDVKYGRQGFGATLTVLTSGPMAPMLEMQKETLRAKVNAAYGYNAIARLRLTQTAPVGFAEGQASFTPAPPEKPAKPSPEATRRAADTAAPVADDGLRDALERMATNIYSNSQKIRKASE